MAKRRKTKSKSKANTKRKILKRNAKTKKRGKKSSKIKVVSDLLSSSYGIGALSKKKNSKKTDMDSFLKGIDNKSSGPYNLDKVFKENQKGYKAQRVNKKNLTPKPPKGKKPKKSSKKKSKYQDFVSKKLKEYKSLDIPQPEKFKKAAAEWNKFKSA
jgi:hypothetical protein